MSYTNQPLASILKRFIALLIDVVLVWAIVALILTAYDIYVRDISWKNSSVLNLGAIILEWVNTGDWLYGQAVMRYPLTYLKSYSAIGVLVPLLLFWLYYGFMEGMGKHASIGKLMMGIKIANQDGSKVSIANASVRYFAKVVSTLILLIGFIMALFNSKRLTLHDNIAKTMVVKS